MSKEPLQPVEELTYDHDFDGYEVKDKINELCRLTARLIEEVNNK